MAWETRFTTTLHFNRASYDSKYKVEEDLNDTIEAIKYWESKLHNFVVMTEPKKFCPEDYDPISWINKEYDEIIENLSLLYVDKFKLECVKEGWEQSHTEDGEPIHPPKDVENKYGEVAFIDGDFILTKEERENEFGI